MENDPSGFLTKASLIVGRWQTDYFSQSLFCECQELKVDSPIEKLLYVALKALALINFIVEADEPIQEDDGWHVPNLKISPQHKIGNYRVDFYISHERKSKHQWEFKDVVVECDSQQFHERTEKERRYEKQRDRFLVSQGHTMLHFTGSEIVQNPWKVAAEILETVCTDKPNSYELIDSLENYLNWND